MLVDIDVPVRFRIHASHIGPLYDLLTTVRDKTREAKLDDPVMDSWINALGEKRQWLIDRKILIADQQGEGEGEVPKT